MYLVTYSSVFKNSLPLCPPVEAAFLLRSLISHLSALAAWIFTDEAYLLITYLLTACSRILLEKITGFQLVKKLHVFYATRRFITAFTRARHLSLSWANSIQSIPPHPTSWRSISTLSSHLRLGLPSGLFPAGFPTRTLHTPLFSPIRATCSAHLILLDFITQTIMGEEYRSFSSSLCRFLHCPVTSSLSGPNILNTLLPVRLKYWKSVMY